MGKFVDITGEKYGMLTVVERSTDYVSPKGYKSVRWRCVCDCGNETIVRACYLKSGAIRSCGCIKVTDPNRKTHGGTGTRLYKIWTGIKKRCYNRNDTNYEDYGGRGILMCGEWREEFEHFRDWAMSHNYSDELTIDRIDNEKGYCPSNCRWADSVTQANNKKTNHFITYNGKTMTMAQWSAETGIKYQKIRDRINRCHWDIERALTTP